MITVVAIVALAITAGLAVWWAGTSHLRRGRQAVAAATVPDAEVAALPAAMRDFALRGDATPGDLAARIWLAQIAEYQRSTDDPWVPLRAEEWIVTGRPGFLWRARQGFGLIARRCVTESLESGQGGFRQQRFGVIPEALHSGPEIDRAEAIRYLAELPWAPDAILGNAALEWTVAEDGWAQATLPVGPDNVLARYRFGADGDVVEMQAPGRPMVPPGPQPARHDFRVYYRNYRRIGPRRVPAEGEAGYVVNGAYRPYFQIRVTDYEALH